MAVLVAADSMDDEHAHALLIHRPTKLDTGKPMCRCPERLLLPTHGTGQREVEKRRSVCPFLSDESKVQAAKRTALPHQCQLYISRI